MDLDLFEVDALAAGVGSSENLHLPLSTTTVEVIGNKRAAAQLLQGVSKNTPDIPLHFYAA